MKSILSIFFILIVFNLVAQNRDHEDTSAFKMGIAVGYYISGDATAFYYSGSDHPENNQRGDTRLESFLNIQQVNNQIRESLGGYNFELVEHAQDMRYNNAASFELELAYNFGKDWHFAVGFHNVNLSAAGIFTLRTDRVEPGNTVEPNLVQADVSGKETRSHINLGFGKKFMLEKHFYLLTEAGVDLNFVEVKENKLQISGRTYSLPTYSNMLNQQATNPTTFGSGFYASTGIGYQLPAQYGFLFKLTYMRSKINVNNAMEASTNIFIPAVGFTKSF